MNKELARDILNLLGTPNHVEVICQYADAQIERAKENLASAADFNQVCRQQGIISSMKELKKIRDTAVGVLSQEK